MPKFKSGDRVKYVGNLAPMLIDQEGTVQDGDDTANGYVIVSFDFAPGDRHINDFNLELLA